MNVIESLNYTIVGLSFITAITLVLIIVPLIIRLSFLINAVDRTVETKLHKTATPILGGIAITLSFIICVLIFIPLDNVLLAFLTGLLIIFFTGIIDDIWQINSILKFAGEITGSLIFILFSGTVIVSFGDLIGTGSIDTGILAFPISVFCMVGVMNALNMADGLDGLAGGISAIACVFLGFFAFTSGQLNYLYMLLILFGSLLGFLYFNKYPAKIFMGDTGSLVLGYLLSTLCILLVQDYGSGIQVLPVSLAIVMGLPIVDALLVMTIRMIKGKNPFLPDNTHLHHRLLILGFNYANTVRIIYLLMVSCGLLAILLRSLTEWQQFVISVIYATIIFGALYTIHYIKVKKSLLDIH